MNVETILEDFNDRLTKILQLKTGWGRVELLNHVKEIITAMKYEYKPLTNDNSIPPWERELETVTEFETSFPERIIIEYYDDGGKVSRVSVPTSLVQKVENEQMVTVGDIEYDISYDQSKEIDKLFFDL